MSRPRDVKWSMTSPQPRLTNALPAVQDHRRTHADFTFVYPVISRRSHGLSLGVNLNPDKVCNFDCIYCEVDRRVPGRAVPVDPARVAEELTALVRSARAGALAAEPRFRDLPPELTREIRDIAFSGDGEPTMIANFAACVEAVIGVRQAEGLAGTKLVLITDAAGLDKADVRRGLALMDAHEGEIWGKLDAGTEAYYRQVNRTTVRFDRILRNLLETARVRPIVIQTLLLQVRGEPMPAAELAAYCDRLRALVAGGGRSRRSTPTPWRGRRRRLTPPGCRRRRWRRWPAGSGPRPGSRCGCLPDAGLPRARRRGKIPGVSPRCCPSSQPHPLPL
jgi:wyosine [tRNA(Phe)-imidazoG37] synthetase (radical SAM superfamily)